MDYSNFRLSNNATVTLTKEQLLSLAALIIDLQQHEWLEEIKVKLRELS